MKKMCYFLEFDYVTHLHQNFLLWMSQYDWTEWVFVPVQASAQCPMVIWDY